MKLSELLSEETLKQQIAHLTESQKSDHDKFKTNAKKAGAVKFVDYDTKSVAYDKDGKRVDEIRWKTVDSRYGKMEVKESVQTFGDTKVVLNNKDWSWDICTGDKVVKSFKFKDADERDEVEKEAIKYAKGGRK